MPIQLTQACGPLPLQHAILSLHRCDTFSIRSRSRGLQTSRGCPHNTLKLLERSDLFASMGSPTHHSLVHGPRGFLDVSLHLMQEICWGALQLGESDAPLKLIYLLNLGVVLLQQMQREAVNLAERC